MQYSAAIVNYNNTPDIKKYQKNCGFQNFKLNHVDWMHWLLIPKSKIY